MKTPIVTALALVGLILANACGSDSSNAGPGETCPAHPGYDRLDETNLPTILHCPEGSEIISDLGIYACGYRDGNGRLVKNGPFVTWGEADKIEIIGYYADGKKTGCQVEWYANRQKFIESNHRQGLLHGDWHVWYEDGQKAQEGAWALECRIGPWKSWYENGQLQSQGTFDEHEASNDWVAWDETGSQSENLRALANEYCPNTEANPDIPNGPPDFRPR